MKGEQHVVFSTFDKNQFVWRYRTIKAVKLVIFRHYTDKKSIFSKKYCENINKKICHFLSLEKWFTMTYSMTL